MTTLYQLVMIMTLQNEPFVMPMQDELTKQMCEEQIAYLRNQPAILHEKKLSVYDKLLDEMGSLEKSEKFIGVLGDNIFYVCFPQRMKGEK